MKRFGFFCFFIVFGLCTINSQQWSSITNNNIWNLNTGNVGVGTNTPSYKLHLQGAPGNLLYITSSNASISESSGILFQGGRGIIGWDGSNTAMKICTSDNSKPIIFSNSLTNGAGELMRINGNGNVGIGTNGSNPLSKLDVNGEIRSTLISGVASNIRLVYGGYSSMLRNDGINTYFLLTNNNDINGSFNSLRPFWINNSNGDVSFAEGKIQIKHSDGILNANRGYFFNWRYIFNRTTRKHIE